MNDSVTGFSIVPLSPTEKEKRIRWLFDLSTLFGSFSSLLCVLIA